MKELADDNFEFDENGRKFSKWVENTVRKGEIARYEQFLLFPQCFQKDFMVRKEKILFTSIFSVSHNGSTIRKRNSIISVITVSLFTNAFNFNQPIVLSLVETF